MRRVSFRTLALMVELLLAVVAVQCLPMRKPLRANAVWLAGSGTSQMAPAPCEVNDCRVDM